MDKNVRDLLQTVNFIKDNIIQDTEVDKRLQLEVHVSRAEKHLGLSRSSHRA